MRFFRNLAGVLVTNTASAPISILSSILLARYLTTDDRGFYALAQNFAAVTTMLVQFGWPSTAIYQLRRSNTPPAEVLGMSLVVLGTVGAVSVGACLLLENLIIDRALSGMAPLVFLLALSTVPLRLLANGLGAIARGVDRFWIENSYQLALGVSNLVAIALILVVSGLAIEALMAGFLAVMCVVVLGLFAAVSRATGLRIRLRSRELAGSFAFSGQIYALTVMGRVHQRADLFLLGALLGDPSQVAFYAVAKGIANLVAQLPGAMAKAAFPEIAGLEVGEAAAFVAQTLRQALVILVPGAIGLAVAAPFLLPVLYGEPYSASYTPLLFLLGATIFQSLGVVIARFFTGTNDHRPNIATRSISAVANVTLSWFWIPAYGIQGAAAALLASYGLDAALILTAFLLRSGIGPVALLTPQRSDFDPYRRLVGWLRARVARG